MRVTEQSEQPECERLRAVVDGIADGMARLLVGREGSELFLPTRELPEAVREGDWLVLTVGRNRQIYGAIVLDPGMRRAMEDRVRSKLDTLRERNKGRHLTDGPGESP